MDSGPDKSRRQCLTLAAVDPTDGSNQTVQISYDRIQALGRRSRGHTKECACIMPMILQKPSAIFAGLRRDEDEDRWGCGWRCYCGIPDKAYATDGAERPPYKDQVYLVFVNDQRVAYNWRWEKADPDDPRLPVDHEKRFKRRLR